MDSIITSPPLAWFIVGFVLVLTELAAPGFIILFFGIGAWVTALLVWIIGFDLTWQLAVFLVSSILSIILLRKMWMRAFMGTSGEAGGDEGLEEASPVGKHVEVTRPVGPGLVGEIKYRGTFWRAVSDQEIQAGVMAEIEATFPDDLTMYKIKPRNVEGEQ